MRALAAPRALNAIQSWIIDEVTQEKDVFEARKKARETLGRQLRGENTLQPWELPDGLDEPLGDDELPEATDDPTGQSHRYLGQAQEPTLPLEDAPLPFPMLDPPVG